MIQSFSSKFSQFRGKTGGNQTDVPFGCCCGVWYLLRGFRSIQNELTFINMPIAQSATTSLHFGNVTLSLETLFCSDEHKCDMFSFQFNHRHTKLAQTIKFLINFRFFHCVYFDTRQMWICRRKSHSFETKKPTHTGA